LDRQTQIESGRTGGWMDGRTERRMTDRQTDRQTEGQRKTDGWKEGHMDNQTQIERGRKYGRTDTDKCGRTDGWMGEQTIRYLESGSTDGQSNTVRKWKDRRMDRRLGTDRKWKVGQTEYKTQIDS
jgi:hypothetical protein